MQYESTLPFFPAVSSKMSHGKPGIVLSMTNPPIVRSPAETPRDFSEWPANDGGSGSFSGQTTSSSSNSTTTNAGASTRQQNAPIALKIETSFRHQQNQNDNSHAFRPSDEVRGASNGDLRAANWMWASSGDGLQQDVPWNARQDIRAVSNQQATPCPDQMSFTPSSNNQLTCLGSPWLPTDSEGAMPSFPISSADAPALTPTVSSTTALHNPAGVPESDLFVNPFEGVSMPLCSPRGFPMSPVHMEGFPPFLTTCETTTVTVEGNENLPTFGGWESRSSPDSACTYNFAFRSGSFSIEGGKPSDGANGAMVSFQTQQAAAWMTPRGDNAGPESQNAQNTIHSSLRRRPRSEIITEADYSSYGQRVGEDSAALQERGAVVAPASKRVVRSSRTTVMRQQAKAVSHPASCISSSVISSRPLPVTPTDCKLAYELVTSRRSGGAGSLDGTAKLQLLTPLNDCYWKNGRKNLQCFPSCPEHSDFYSMKMNNRKHSSVGVCRGPVYCHVLTTASNQQVTTSTPSASSSMALTNGFVGAGTTNTTVLARHMKYELGVGASSSGGGTQELFVLGRFERVPQQHESASLLLEHLAPPPTFDTSASFEQFRYSCFQAVEMEERRVLVPASSPDSDRMNPNVNGAGIVRSTWFFLPDVWKVRPMLKKKRKATRSAPAQTFPFCFRVFVYARAPSSDETSSEQRFECLSATTSSFFELYSTRTVDRVKRRVWGGGSSPTDNGSANEADDDLPPTKRRATRT